MGRRDRELDANEKALWRRVAESARPLAHPGKAAPPVATATAADTGTGLAPRRIEHAAAARMPDANHPLRPGGLDRRTEQRLRRGQLDVDARLDLHGMTQKAAHAALRRFLAEAQARGWRLVLVITGKGGSPFEEPGCNSRGEARGVLKRQLPQWLAGPDLRSIVAGIQPAHPRHGGGGAFYVRVRRPRP